MIRAVRLMLVVCVLFLCASLGYASTTLCTEDNATGCVAAVFHGPTYNVTVVGDGETAIDPFHGGFDISDGIDFSGYTPLFQFVGQAGWVQLTTGPWVLPADLTGVGCGIENEPVCEPIGQWRDILPTSNWAGQEGVYYMYDATGNRSDVISLFDTVDANGQTHAVIRFSSDPIPEPGSLVLLGSGLLGLAAVAKRRLLG